MLFKTIVILAFISYFLCAIFMVKGYTTWFRGFILAGIGFNILAMVSRGYVAGRWYFYPVADEIYTLPAAIAFVTFSILHRPVKNNSGLILTPLVIAALIAVVIPYESVILTIKGMTIASPFFFLTEAASAAFFLTSGMLALSSRISGTNNEKRIERLILWGFIIFTVCQVLGAVWAFLGWSYPFSWSTRHLLSAAIWCFYAALVHARLIWLTRSAQLLFTIGGIIPVVYMVYHHQIISGLKFIVGVFT
jgi:hypothetical protein